MRLTIEVVIERKHPEMPAFVVVPAAKVARWGLEGTTTVEGTLDGVALGRRSLRRWDERRWYLELPRGLLDAAGKAPGARARLSMAVASEALPVELQSLIDSVTEVRARWEAMTDAQRRMLREHVLTAKSSEARERRVWRALRPAAGPPAPRVPGLDAGPRDIVVRVIGRRLPGRSCGPYSDVVVGLAQKVGCDPGPEECVSADARGARWETKIEVREREGRPAFRGRAVNGPPQERFLYLTWIGRKGGEAPAMFRRAKLRLDAVPADVLAGALRSGVLIGRLDLTACDGLPVAASVRPPDIVWSCS